MPCVSHVMHRTVKGLNKNEKKFSVRKPEPFICRRARRSVRRAGESDPGDRATFRTQPRLRDAGAPQNSHPGTECCLL